MSDRGTIEELRAFQRGLNGYRQLLEAVWKRTGGWGFSPDERSRADALRADLAQQYGYLRPALAAPRGGIRTLASQGEVFDVALMEPTDNPLLSDALDGALHDVALAIGHAERTKGVADHGREDEASDRPPRRRERPPSAEVGDGVAWRNATAAACAGISGLLLAYTFQPFMFPPSDEVRPYLFAASAAFILLGSLILITRKSRRHGTPSDVREQEQEIRVEGGANGATAQQSAITGTGNTVTQAARDAIATQINVGRWHDEFQGAPHLNWDSQIFKRKAEDYELQVLCTLNGQDARVDPVSWVRSSDSADRVEFVEFDTTGLIRVNPGTFWLRMRLVRPTPGERVVRWRIVYHDTHMRRGYVTECSIPVSIRLDQMRHDASAGAKALDLTSPETRYERYRLEYGTAPHSGST